MSEIADQRRTEMLSIRWLEKGRLTLGVLLVGAVALAALIPPSISYGQNGAPQSGFDDHQNMMDQLGVKAIRRGPNPNDQSTFDEAKSNPYKDSMPDVLRMNDGTKVTKRSQWLKRR